MKRFLKSKAWTAVFAAILVAGIAFTASVLIPAGDEPPKSSEGFQGILGSRDTIPGETKRIYISSDYGSMYTLEYGGPDEVTVYNVNLAAANTEYHQKLATNTVAFLFRNRGATETRFAYETGYAATQVSPFMSLRSGDVYYKNSVMFASKTLFFAASETGYIEIEAWTY